MTTATTTPLTKHDLAAVERESWINQATADRFGLYRVDSADGAALVGRDNRENYAGIVFPIYWPGSDHPREYVLRRDHPPLEYSDGRPKPKGKYLAPPGRSNYLLFGPDELPDALTDTTLPIVLVEGLKKLCAAWRLSRFDREQARFLAMAISGVWNWRGTVGKTTDEHGARVDVKGVISDFDRVVWNDRDVIVIFDSDCASNPSVAAARRGLIAELRKRGARVSALDLPGLDGLEKTGFDDLLAQRGPEFALGLIEAARGESDRRNGTEAAPATRKSQGTLLIEMAEAAVSVKEVELFHRPDHESYASVVVTDHWETWPLRSKTRRTWIARRFFETTSKAVSSQGLQDALNVLDAKAKFAGSNRLRKNSCFLLSSGVY